MAVYELGDTVTLTHAGASDDDAQLFVTAPDGTESEPTVTFSAGTGLWSGQIVANQYDQWEFAWRLDGEIVDTGVFVVGGPWYSTLAQLRHELNIPSTNTTHDTGLARALEAASRSVEAWCDTRPIGGFLLADESSARVYRPTMRGPVLPGAVLYLADYGEYRLYVHEIGASGYTVETSDDGSTWTELTEDTDYRAYPDNALVLNRPIEAFVADDWPTHVRVTARWGWPAVPTQVAEATLRTAARAYRRKDSPDGVAGSSDWGLIRVPNLDPDVRQMLSVFHADAMIA